MTELPALADAASLPPEQLIARLDTLPDLELLRGLPDRLVLALPDEVLEWRRDKLLASRKGVSGKQVAAVIGSGDSHAQRLRTNFLEAGVTSRDALPPPDEDLSDDDIRRPGDGRTSRGGSARWRLGVLVQWTIDFERVDDQRRGGLTLLLRPGGRKPPGRPRNRVLPAI